MFSPSPTSRHGRPLRSIHQSRLDRARDMGGRGWRESYDMPKPSFELKTPVSSISQLWSKRASCLAPSDAARRDGWRQRKDPFICRERTLSGNRSGGPSHRSMYNVRTCLLDLLLARCIGRRSRAGQHGWSLSAHRSHPSPSTNFVVDKLMKNKTSLQHRLTQRYHSPSRHVSLRYGRRCPSKVAQWNKRAAATRLLGSLLSPLSSWTRMGLFLSDAATDNCNS